MSGDGGSSALAAALFFGVAAFSSLCVYLRGRPSPMDKPGIPDSVRHLLQHGRRRLIANMLDVGGFFGADIGGSLAKLVFFMPSAGLVEWLMHRAPKQRVEAARWQEKMDAVHRLSTWMLSRERYGHTGVRDAALAMKVDELGGTFHFVRFETRRMEGAIQLARENGLNLGMQEMCATGGGAHRFETLAKTQLGLTLKSGDEIDCLVKGLAFFMSYTECEAYTFRGASRVERRFEGVSYPYLLVNVGSGIGFILVSSETTWRRVSGSALGGGTFYGLCHALTGLSSFDEMLRLAEAGDSNNVDLTVGDIYGGDYGKFGLSAATLACSFGKAVSWPLPLASASASAAPQAAGDSAAANGTVPIGGSPARATAAAAAPSSAGSDESLARSVSFEHAMKSTSSVAAVAATAGASASSTVPAAGGQQQQFGKPRAGSSVAGGGSGESAPEVTLGGLRPPVAPADVCLSLLIMMSNNIGQIAYQTAKLHGCREIFFAGNFLRTENTVAMRQLAAAIKYWSQDSMEGLFLKHEGYCGALGAFLSTLESTGDLPD